MIWADGLWADGLWADGLWFELVVVALPANVLSDAGSDLQRWIVHRDERERLGVQCIARLAAGETIESVGEIVAWNAAGDDVTSDLIEGQGDIADYTDRAGTVHDDSAIHFWKRPAPADGDQAAPATYYIEVEYRTSFGRVLVTKMRNGLLLPMLVT